MCDCDLSISACGDDDLVVAVDEPVSFDQNDRVVVVLDFGDDALSVVGA